MFDLQNVIQFRLDVAVLIVATLAATFLLHRRLRDEHGAGIPATAWGVIGLLLVIGAILPEFGGERERLRLRDMLSGVAPTYAQELSHMGHEKLTFDTSPDDPLYLQMVEAQLRWLKANPNVNDIYTFRYNSDRRVAFIVDSETDYDHNGKFESDREQRTEIGEVYDELTPGMVAALQGEANFDGIPYTDRWGTWVSALVPMYGKDGKVEGALGVDYAAHTWLRQIAFARLSSMLIVVIAITAFLSAVTIVTITRAELRKRTQLEKERELLQAELMLVSRRAGMAEVATGVLHNVGNVLNSVNVSARMIARGLKDSKLGSLGRIVELVREQKDQLGEFVTRDERGRLLPDFLSELYGRLNEDQRSMERELEQLVSGVEHIKEVVRMQQGAATASTVIAPCDPVSVMEDAVKINLVSMERHRVELVRDYEPGLQPLPIDKHKVLQILINLISNAKKATCNPGIQSRVVRLSVRRVEEGRSIEFSVADNGIGISAEGMEKLFRHGVTAFKDGHGFGLHSGILAAKEMNGTLTAHSEGLGKGAEFKLVIPIRSTVAEEVRT
jgi:signal transduction histidine kinase